MITIDEPFLGCSIYLPSLEVIYLGLEIDMATWQGGIFTSELFKKGWKIKHEEGEPFRCGDATLIDPVDGKEYGPFEAKVIQDEREKSNG